MNLLATPLENHRYQRYSSSAEVAGYLAGLAAAAPAHLRLQTIGCSAQGRPLLALICSRSATPSLKKLRIMMVGSQHGGSEAAGCEALLLLAQSIADGELRELLDDFEFMLIPNANPDGRDADSSRNGNDVNINRDYVLLTQPESCALDAAVIDFAPDVILDAHESASYKRKTLGREGYLTDFEAQFDIANTPAIPSTIRAYLEHTLLPSLLQAVASRGLRAQRYIREITSITQPLTHGGFTIRKFRNKAGIRGPLTLLLETPMEPKAGQYPTHRNIGVRVEKQCLCMHAFITCVVARALEIRATIVAAATESPPTDLALNARYIPNGANPETVVSLRRRDTGAPIEIAFPDHRAMVIQDFVAVPRYYVISAHCQLFAALLARHRIAFEVLTRRQTRALKTRLFARGEAPDENWSEYEPWEGDVALKAGALRVPLAQAARRMIPLLLDPRSESSVFRYQSFGRLIDTGSPLFIYDDFE